MKFAPARISTGVSVAWLLLGIFILSPSGSVFFAAWAMLFAIAPVVIGPKVVRMVGIVFLVLSTGLVAVGYPSFVEEQERYVEKASKRQTPSQSPS